MSAAFNKGAYLRRLFISFGVVCISAFAASRLDLHIALIAPWCLLFNSLDAFVIVNPVLLGVVILLILAVAALRFSASIIVTLWFAMNSLVLWKFFASFPSGPSG